MMLHPPEERKMRIKSLPKNAAYGIDLGKKVFHVVARRGAVIQRVKIARLACRRALQLHRRR
jgi:hypothetical protein